MQNVFPVKDASQVVNEVYINGQLVVNKKDYKLTDDAIVVEPGLKAKEVLTYKTKVDVIVR